MDNTDQRNFTDDRHALYVGWVVGIARSNGVDAVPMLDGDNNYTDRIEIHFAGGNPAVQVTVVVPPPPEDWTL